MRGDALEDMPEVAVRIDAIESARTDEAVEARSGLAARIRAGEEVVSASEHKRPDRTLCGVICPDYDSI